MLTQPDEVEADQGLAEAAASQITALRIVTEVDNTKDPSIFGFDQPAYILTIGFEGGTTSTERPSAPAASRKPRSARQPAHADA